MSGTVVIGATGGCGTTTVACGLALMLGADGAAPLLVDADLHAGGPGALWSLDAARALDDLGDLGSDVVPQHVGHLVHRHACGVDVMAGCASAKSSVVHDPATCAAVADYAASRPCWVADGGRGDSGLAAALMARADRVVMMVPCTLRGAARAAAIAPRIDARNGVSLAAGWVPGERVPARVLGRSLGWPDAGTVDRDDRAAADVAAGRTPRGRRLARLLQGLVASW